MIRSVTLWPFMQKANPRLNMAQYETLIQGAQRELGQPELKLYLNLYALFFVMFLPPMPTNIAAVTLHTAENHHVDSARMAPF